MVFRAEDYRYSSAVDYSDEKGLLDNIVVFRMFDFLRLTTRKDSCGSGAKKTNAQCKALFDRLVKKGKNKKAAVIAVCNKLLKIVFGIVKNKTMYQDNFIVKSA